jgi:hypothetical protein
MSGPLIERATSTTCQRSSRFRLPTQRVRRLSTGRLSTTSSRLEVVSVPPKSGTSHDKAMATGLESLRLTRLIWQQTSWVLWAADTKVGRRLPGQPYLRYWNHS